MKSFRFFAILVSVVGLHFSCTSDKDSGVEVWERLVSASSSGDLENYCVYSVTKQCFGGSYSTCPGTGGVVSNTCPYSSSGNGSSSSGGVLSDFNFCVFSADKDCLPGPVSQCPPGGELSNTCPYNSSSSGAAINCPTPSGSNVFVDQRDCEEYKFETAPNGKIWMAENLNYSKNNTLGWCHAGNGEKELGEAGVDLAGCDNGNGRLYTYAIAMNENSLQGLCPDGWHIPTTAEWEGVSDMSSSFYIKAGNYDTKDGWKAKGTYGFYWASNTSASFAFISGTSISINPRTVSTDYFSVRCVNDFTQSSSSSSSPYTYCSENISNFCSDADLLWNQTSAQLITTTTKAKCFFTIKISEINIPQGVSGVLINGEQGSSCYASCMYSLSKVDDGYYIYIHAPSDITWGNITMTAAYPPCYQELCGNTPFNPTTKFCGLDGIVHEKCGGTAEGDKYNPNTEDCCGSKKFTVASQFCLDNKEIYNLCGSSDYDPAKEYCKGGSVTPLPCEISTGKSISEFAEGDCFYITTDQGQNCPNNIQLYNYGTGTWSGIIYCEEAFEPKDISCSAASSDPCVPYACPPYTKGAYLKITTKTGNVNSQARCY